MRVNQRPPYEAADTDVTTTDSTPSQSTIIQMAREIAAKFAASDAAASLGSILLEIMGSSEGLSGLTGEQKKAVTLQVLALILEQYYPDDQAKREVLTNTASSIIDAIALASKGDTPINQQDQPAKSGCFPFPCFKA